LARVPADEEVQQLVALYQGQAERYRKDSKAADAMAGKPADSKTANNSNEGAKPKPVDPAELAAWTVVANVLLNLDEAVTK